MSKPDFYKDMHKRHDQKKKEQTKFPSVILPFLPLRTLPIATQRREHRHLSPLFIMRHTRMQSLHSLKRKIHPMIRKWWRTKPILGALLLVFVCAFAGLLFAKAAAPRVVARENLSRMTSKVNSETIGVARGTGGKLSQRDMERLLWSAFHVAARTGLRTIIVYTDKNDSYRTEMGGVACTVLCVTDLKDVTMDLATSVLVVLKPVSLTMLGDSLLGRSPYVFLTGVDRFTDKIIGETKLNVLFVTPLFALVMTHSPVPMPLLTIISHTLGDHRPPLPTSYYLHTNPRSPFKVCALLAGYNEGDILLQTIFRYVSEGIHVHYIDNDSTDGSPEKLRALLDSQPYLASMVKMESFTPIQGKGVYAWTEILMRKERLASYLPFDWFLHADVDEIREGPFPGAGLLESFELVDKLGFNAISFSVATFHPVDNAFNETKDLRTSFEHYSWDPLPGNWMQRKAWKSQKALVSLATTAGHNVNFAGINEFPLLFLLRHYPIRTQEQGERKVFADRLPRFSPGETKNGWHVQYRELEKGHSFIRSTGHI